MRGSAIKIAARTLYGLAVLIVGEPVNYQGAELAQDVGRNVAGALRGQNAGQPVFAAFLCHDAERI